MYMLIISTQPTLLSQCPNFPWCVAWGVSRSSCPIRSYDFITMNCIIYLYHLVGTPRHSSLVWAKIFLNYHSPYLGMSIGLDNKRLSSKTRVARISGAFLTFDELYISYAFSDFLIHVSLTFYALGVQPTLYYIIYYYIFRYTFITKPFH